MGIIGNAFKREIGKNTGKTVSNIIFGDKWSTPYRRADAARETRAEAQRIRQEADAERISEKVREDHARYLNSVDNAVIQNIDQVIAIRFDDVDPSHLCHQLQGLIVQLKVNNFKDNSDEDKIRAKYSNAVLEKSKQGLELLVAIDPLNKQIPYFDKQILEAERTKSKVFKWYLIISVIIAFFISILSPILAVIIWGIVTLFVLIGCSIIRKIREKKYVYIVKAQKEQRTNALAQSKKQDKYEHIIKQKEDLDSELLQKQDELRARKETKTTQKETSKSEILKQHDALWERYYSLHPILERGYQVCETTEHKDILIIGLCSNSPTGNSHNGLSAYPFHSMVDQKIIMDMLVGQGFNLFSASTYLDLFSCKELADVIRYELIQNPKTFDYVVNQVRVAQNVIEDIITPKIIIILEKDAWAFFGRIKKLTWMGYSYQIIGDVNGLEICEITGFTNAKDRLAQDTRHQTNLIGTKIIFTNYSEQNKLPKAEQLLSYLK